MPTVQSFNTARARSYLLRLPILTRIAVGIIVAAWVLGIQGAWDIRAWGALVPDKTGLANIYRSNTYPFIHVNFLHAILNILSLTPLLERFESEYGTLTALALFLGPFSTLPAIIYVLLERFVLHKNNAIMGASIWVFLLLGMEAMKTYQKNPHLSIATYQIPTWTTPLLVLLCVTALVPGTSLLGHLCGLGIGYICGLGYLRLLSPPEKVLRWLEARLQLLQRVPHYVSIDQKTYGRFGVLPSSNAPNGSSAIGFVGTSQRLGP